MTDETTTTTVEEKKEKNLTIPKSNISFLQWKIEKLNKRAKKLGVEPITYKIVREFSVQIRDEFTGFLRPEKWFYEIEIINQAPVHLPGWELVAVITLVGEEKLVKTVPDKTVPDTFRTADYICEHCNKIRNRKDTFVMFHNETGEYKQIGRQCIQDFLGGDPTRIFNMASWVNDINKSMSDVDDEMAGWGHGGRHDKTWSLEEMMNLACALIRKTGYWSVKACRDMDGKSSTYSDTMWLLAPAWNAKEEQKKREFIQKWELKVEDQDIQMAEKVIEWAKQISSTTTNNYLYNLGVAARSGLASHETAALLISSIEAYRKEVEKIEYEKKEKKESNWIGEIKERVVIKGVKQIFRKAQESAYRYDGIETFVKLEQVETGNIIVWRASNDVDFGNEVVDIKCTIKAHKEYKGRKETWVTRVVDLSEPKEVQMEVPEGETWVVTKSTKTSTNELVGRYDGPVTITLTDGDAVHIQKFTAEEIARTQEIMEETRRIINLPTRSEK